MGAHELFNGNRGIVEQCNHWRNVPHISPNDHYKLLVIRIKSGLTKWLITPVISVQFEPDWNRSIAPNLLYNFSIQLKWIRPISWLQIDFKVTKKRILFVLHFRRFFKFGGRNLPRIELDLKQLKSSVSRAIEWYKNTVKQVKIERVGRHLADTLLSNSLKKDEKSIDGDPQKQQVAPGMSNERKSHFGG